MASSVRAAGTASVAGMAGPSASHRSDTVTVTVDTILPECFACRRKSDIVKIYDFIEETMTDCAERIYGLKSLRDDRLHTKTLKDALSKWLTDHYVEHSETFTGTQSERLALSLSGCVGQCRLYLVALDLYAQHNRNWMDVAVLDTKDGHAPLGIAPGLTDVHPFQPLFDSLVNECYRKSIYTIDAKTQKPITTSLEEWKVLSDKIDMVAAALTIVSSEQGIGSEFEEGEADAGGEAAASPSNPTALDADGDGKESKEDSGESKDEKKSSPVAGAVGLEGEAAASPPAPVDAAAAAIQSQKRREIRNDTTETAVRLHYWIQMQLRHVQERKMQKMTFPAAAYQRLRTKFSKFMYYEPDNSLKVAFDQFVYAHNMPCGLHIRYHQMYPPHSFDTEVVTVMNEMLTRDQIKALHKWLNGTELQAMFRNKTHGLLPLFELFLFCSLLAMKYKLLGFFVKETASKDASGAEYTPSVSIEEYILGPYMLPYEQPLLRQRVRPRDRISNRPRCPIICLLLGQWYVLNGTGDIYACDTALDAALTWMMCMKGPPFHGRLEDKLDIRPFIEETLP